MGRPLPRGCQGTRCYAPAGQLGNGACLAFLFEQPYVLRCRRGMHVMPVPSFTRIGASLPLHGVHYLGGSYRLPDHVGSFDGQHGYTYARERSECRPVAWEGLAPIPMIGGNATGCPPAREGDDGARERRCYRRSSSRNPGVSHPLEQAPTSTRRHESLYTLSLPECKTCYRRQYFMGCSW